MSNHDLAIVILAAGKGTRLKSSRAKVLHRAGGRSLVEQVVRSCAPLKARETVVVVGHQAEQVAALVEPLGAVAVLQQPQNGTGHAMQMARRPLGRAKSALVLPGDAPLVRPETLKALIAAHQRTARDQRNQFGDLLLHAGETLALAGTGEAEQQAPRTLFDRRDRGYGLERRDRPRSSGLGPPRSARL